MAFYTDASVGLHRTKMILFGQIRIQIFMKKET